MEEAGVGSTGSEVVEDKLDDGHPSDSGKKMLMRGCVTESSDSISSKSQSLRRKLIAH